MIKFILFDLGGILVNDCSYEILENIAAFLKKDIMEIRNALQNHWCNVTTGKNTLLAVYNELQADLNINSVDPNEILKIHLKTYNQYSRVPNRDILKLIQKLKKKYLVACLTNTEPEIFAINKKRGLYKYFHKAFISTEIKMAKPDSKIFKKVLEDLDARPEETIFIDDKKANVETANKIGINGILYYNLQRLLRDLGKLKAL
ncbi:MAG TPA: HAD-IA family hydrolase [Ignavibacteriaceae bacterium]|nr:HAD-IA family hydrolase [Ignavibacteriaceae bacterium]